MMIDPVYRLDLYGLSSKLSQRHWAHLVQELSDHPDVVAKAKAALTAEESAVVQAAFGNVQYKEGDADPSCHFSFKQSDQVSFTA
jgi:hypothetical protein